MPMLNVSSSASQFFTLPFRRRKQRYTINPPDDSYSVIYLGNVLTVLANGEHCFDKPLALIWKAYCCRHGSDLTMELDITRSGLKAETKEQGLTEYWAHRITSSCAPNEHPKIFCWIYKHDGKRLKPELRCHAVLCKRSSDPLAIHTKLQEYLHSALQEYRREKLSVQNARLTGFAGCPRRKRMLHSGSLNFRPPVCRSKSAPRLGSIDEEQEIEENINNESVCYQAEPEILSSCSPANNAVKGDSYYVYYDDEYQKTLGSLEFDSISDESGYHEEKYLRGFSEDSYYSDGELVMLEEDYEESDKQMTSL
ncbi:hypothetical protein DICVIV_12232 [Dictyocaulus viviparus]|uniref:PID domain-containing protein n=1 Tax=Dictyocaulus viviparus TaxID=29172 RepID=A0A0D8XDF1_DICVI|nr:hypothetical protein DICVIV_12232 [Dictyocaulus viviparus]